MPVGTTDVAASPAEIWAIVSDPSRITEWLAPIRTLDRASPDVPFAPGQAFKVSLHGRVPPSSLRVRAVQAERHFSCAVGPGFAHALGLAMRADVRLAPTDAGTSVTVEIACNRIMGPLQQAISGMDVAAATAESAARLKELVEPL